MKSFHLVDRAFLSYSPIQSHTTQTTTKLTTSINMEKAKAAVGNFLHKDGKHDTTVHEVCMLQPFLGLS